MQTVFLGEYIKAKRLELGLTQENLCEGICEPMTLSRLENGKQTPSRNTINALLQRLGLPDDRYFALLSKREKEIEALQKEIHSCNVLRNNKLGLEKIAELEPLVEIDDHVTQQFLLRCKANLGKQEGDTILPYSFEEKLDLLMQAIHLTIPRFTLDSIEQHLYTMDEVKIINSMANCFSNSGRNDQALKIYEQLFSYIRTHYQNILQSGGLLPLVAECYARSLDIAQQYEKALEIGQLGVDAGVKYGQYFTLCGSLSIMAECHYFLGHLEESEKLYYQAYYMALSVRDQHVAQVIREEMQKYLSITPKF